MATVVNDAKLFPRDRAIELSRLNDAERRVLRMLAEGHTAKSVANAIGSTPAAVNERLREARRKTGVGSSRELARMLKAQENRHEQIGVGRQPARASDRQSAGGGLIRPDWKGPIAMTLALLTVLAAAAVVVQQTPPASNEVDPLLGEPLIKAPDPSALHARVRSEPRDGNWAPGMETAIRSRLLQIPLIGKVGNVLRVTCATDLCEIAGTIVWPAPPPKEYDPKLPQNRAESDLQAKPLNDDLAKLGLKHETGLFTGGRGKPDRMVFLIYYSHAKS